MKMPLHYAFQIIHSEELYKPLLSLLEEETAPEKGKIQNLNLDAHSVGLIIGTVDDLHRITGSASSTEEATHPERLELIRSGYLRAWELARCPGVDLYNLREMITTHAPGVWEKIRKSIFGV